MFWVVAIMGSKWDFSGSLSHLSWWGEIISESCATWLSQIPSGALTAILLIALGWVAWAQTAVITWQALSLGSTLSHVPWGSPAMPSQCLLVIKFCVLNFLSSRESINVRMIFKYLVIFQLVKNLQGKEITGHAIMQCKSIKWECIHWQHLYFHLLQSCAISLNTIHFYAPLKHAWHSFQLLANAEKLKNNIYKRYIWCIFI